MEAITPYLTLENVSVLLSLIFLVLMIRESIWCWLFGIISSALSVYLFYTVQLYSETILYIFYVLFGIYGWWIWFQKTKTQEAKEETFQVSKWNLRQHIIGIVSAIIVAELVGTLFKNYTEAANPYLDASTTAFSFLASYMEAHKILSTWHFWIVINGVTIWLYYSRGLQNYALLMVVYFVVSFYGLYNWNKKAKAVLP